VITPKGYSSILRSLYLSSYLTENSSNEILEILTQTAFNDKIPASLPSHITVAHKVGIFNSPGSTERVFADCGIVYVPQRSYLLCIMTSANEVKATEYMQHLSKMVYGYIVAARANTH
jgi:beta-lactamase class A